MREDDYRSYFLTDHLGSIVGVTDSTDVLISETRYDPFGEARTDVGSITQTDYGYTNQQIITGTGLVDYNARMYDPSLGRFTQPDSLVPDPTSSIGFNRYAYVNNNPINFTDPSGHLRCDDGDADGNCDNNGGGGGNGGVEDEGGNGGVEDEGGGGGIDINGEGIWDWAINHDGLRDPEPSFHSIYDPAGCTDFCSTALYLGGGVPLTQQWMPYEMSWIRAEDFYNYLTTDLSLSTIELTIVPKDGTMISEAEINNWFAGNEIPVGSFVFYDTNTDGTKFSHVGIIGPETIPYYGITTPIMTDMNGSSVGSRSLLNTRTFNNNIINPTHQNPYRIVIVIVP